MSAAEEIHTEAVKHRIALNRYSTGLVRKIIAQLHRSEIELVARMITAADDSVSRRRIEDQLAAFRAIQKAGWDLVAARLEGELEALAEVEAVFAAKVVRVGADALQISVVSPVPPMSQIVAAVKARPFSGKLLREWLSEAEEGVARRVRDVVRMGYIEGQTIDQMVRAIRGTKANNYRDGALEVSRRGAEAMVRTAVTHTSNVASQEIYRSAGESIVAGWEFVATLDSRTSLTCAGLDGKAYPVGSGPMPPRHINCRSVTIPRLRGMKPTPRTTYADWLKRQPKAVQDDILGTSKGALFRTGDLPVDRFTDRAGRELTLDQLRARDADAFRKAGIAA